MLRNVLRRIMVFMLVLCVVGGLGLSFDTSAAYAAKKKVKAKSVSLNYSTYTLKKGKTVKLKATVLPKNASQKKIVWTTSNKKVATVKNGKVKAVGKKGKATITATVKGTKKKAKAVIYVGTPAKAAVFNVSGITMETGQTRTVAASITPANATIKGINYESSNTGVATVTAGGAITAVSAGTAVITATPKDSAGKKATLTVTVKDPMKVALVTDSGDITDQAFNQTIYGAIKNFCLSNHIEYTYKIPASFDPTDLESKIKEAISERCNVILVPGFAFAEVLGKVAPANPGVKFIAIDVSSGDFNNGVPGNVYCAVYKEEQAGFMAGYAAVKMGYTKLGFLGGPQFPAIERYGYGFIQGVDAAAGEGNIPDAEVRYVFTGQFAPDNSIKATVSSWYNAGTQCVFACGGGIYVSAAEAASEGNGRKIIGVDVDQSAVIDGEFAQGMTLTSAMKGLVPTVNAALGAVKNGKWDSYKGRCDSLGIVSDNPAENYVQLPDTTQWRDSFQREDYATLVSKIRRGELVVSDDTESVPAVNNIKVIED